MHRETQSNYDKLADQFSQHYDAIGPREGDIEIAFALAGNPVHPTVLEIGCGNGRDAQAIARRAAHYTGIDASEKMIAKAKQRVPDGHFEHVNATAFDYPESAYDVVFAFASFRHMDIEEVTDTLEGIYRALKPGGVVYISSNLGHKYESVEQASSITGQRHIYTYNPDIIQKHAPSGFKRIYEMEESVDGQRWFEVALKREQ